MSDWIEKLKAQKEQKEQQATERERAKQRKFDLVRWKLPEFIRQTSERVKADIVTLREAFPNDLNYDLRYEEEPPGFNLNLPTISRGIRLRLDPTQTQLRVYLDHRPLAGHGFNEQMDWQINLDVNDSLSIERGGLRFSRPEQFSEYLVRLAAEIRG